MTDTIEMEAVVGSYFAALNDGNAERLVETFTDDVVLMLHDRPTIVGKDAARAMYTQHVSHVSFQRVLHIDETGADGDLGYVRCHSTGTVTPRATGTPREVRGRELFLLERENGAWKIHSYVMNHLS